MIRKTLLGLAAVAALTAAASSANAGVKIHIGGYGWGPYYGGYYQPYYGGFYNCHKVFIGYKSYWNGWKWKKKAIYKKVCY